MNNVSIMGRMTADPKCDYTPNGTPVLKFTVAVDRPKTKDTTDFIKCVAWRNAAEFIERYFKKGKMIAVSGIMTSRSWTGDDNKKHYVMELLVDTVEFCGDKSSAAQPAEQPHAEQAVIKNWDGDVVGTVQTTLDDIPDSFQAAEADFPI